MQVSRFKAEMEIFLHIKNSKLLKSSLNVQREMLQKLIREKFNMQDNISKGMKTESNSEIHFFNDAMRNSSEHPRRNTTRSNK